MNIYIQINIHKPDVPGLPLKVWIWHHAEQLTFCPDKHNLLNKMQAAYCIWHPRSVCTLFIWAFVMRLITGPAPPWWGNTDTDITVLCVKNLSFTWLILDVHNAWSTQKVTLGWNRSHQIWHKVKVQDNSSKVWFTVWHICHFMLKRIRRKDSWMN